MGHVLGQCLLECLATITSGNDIVAKLYGPWLRAKYGGSLLSINSTPAIDRSGVLTIEDCVMEKPNPQPEKCLLIECLENHFLEAENTIPLNSGQRK